VSDRARSAAALAPLCMVAGFLFLAPLFVTEIVLQKWWWAGLHFWRLPVLPVAWGVVAALIPVAVLLAPDDVYTRARSAVRARIAELPPRLLHPAALLCAGIFLLWIFRSVSLIFGDAYFYVTDLIPTQAFSDRGMIIMFDSVGATFMYSFGYRFANLWFGLDVLQWYNVAGIATLLAFLAWAWRARGRRRFLGTGLVLALLFTGNWSQATMGAPEHYGQLLLAILAFSILAWESFEGREPTWKPCLAYSLGAFFHLGIGWMFPALLWLVVRRWKRDNSIERTFALLAMILPALLTGVMTYDLGFDLTFFTASNAGKGKFIPLIGPTHPWSGANYQYATFDPRHLAHIAQEVVLMGWPGLLLIAGALPHAEWRWFARNEKGVFLLAMLGGALLLCLLWNPDLEFWRDQDLFSMVGIPVCLVGVVAVLGPPGDRMSPALRQRLLAAALLGGLAWRIPVILYHSVLALNYFDSGVTGAWWPFEVSFAR